MSQLSSDRPTAIGEPVLRIGGASPHSNQTYGVKRGLWPSERTPAHLQAVAWSTWAYVTYGAQLVRLQAANDLGTPA